MSDIYTLNWYKYAKVLTSLLLQNAPTQLKHSQTLIKDSRMKMNGFYLIAVFVFSGILQAACQKFANPSFEQTPAGNGWTFFNQGSNTIPVTFPVDKARAYKGSRLALLSLKKGAVFPARVYVGQKRRLASQVRYRVSVWARVDSGVSLQCKRGAIVSVFCEQEQSDGGGYIGQDTTLNEVTGSFKSSGYRRITFDLVGDGKPWTCFTQILAQPTAATKVEVSVDEFRLFKSSSIAKPGRQEKNVIRDGQFREALATPTYSSNRNTCEFLINISGRKWFAFFFAGKADKPTFIGSGGNREIKLQLPRFVDRDPNAFTGVVQKVRLYAGQRYELCIDYKRISTKPSNVRFTIFNYLVRFGTNFGDDTVLRDSDDGLLLGRVDVRVGNEKSGTSDVQFIVPKTSSNYQVVLKLNAYGNERVRGVYSMSFSNAKLVPISNAGEKGCRK